MTKEDIEDIAEQFPHASQKIIDLLSSLDYEYIEAPDINIGERGKYLVWHNGNDKFFTLAPWERFLGDKVPYCWRSNFAQIERSNGREEDPQKALDDMIFNLNHFTRG